MYLLLVHSLWLSGSHSVVNIQLEIVRSAHSQDHPRPTDSETNGGPSYLSTALSAGD